MTTVNVECYSGSRYAERPIAVHWQGQRLEVVQVLRSWRTADGPGFDVTVVDGRKFRLMYDGASDRWRVADITSSGCSVED